MSLSQILSKVARGLRMLFAPEPARPRKVDPARVTFARLGLLAYYG
jgi:hypothetical protein